MLEFEKILAPTDLSEISLLGVRTALDLARSKGAEVIVYNVVGSDETTVPVGLAELAARHEWEIPKIQEILEERRRRLLEFLKTNFGDLIRQTKLRVEVGFGVAHERIVERADQEKADLIVMSTHGRGGVARLLLGSVTEKVLRFAACPVLSIRPAAMAGPTQSPSRATKEEQKEPA